MNWSKVIERILDEHKNWSPETIATYRYQWKSLMTFAGRNLKAITKQQIQDWIDLSPSPSTECVKAAAVRTLYRELLDEDLVNYNPTLGLATSKVILPEIRPLTDNEMFKLYEVARGNKRDIVIIDLFCCAGPRVSELINLLRSDVIFSEETIDIRFGKGLKERKTFFTYQCKERMRLYLESRLDSNPLLFVNKNNDHFSRQGVHKMFKHYIEKAGLRTDLTIHNCRHTYATRLANNGFSVKDISDLMGHKDPNTTRRYIDPVRSNIQSNYDLFK